MAFYFLTVGLLVLSELRESYLEGEVSGFGIAIRYISLILFGILIGLSTYIKNALPIQPIRNTFFEISVHVSILWVTSSELIHWLSLSGFQDSYKLGLSILWGVYSLLLIILGIWKNKKFLRIGAISLFGITLTKLFLYDMRDLSTISKTVVFLALGVLLLIISFLYNKYKDQIAGNEKS